MPETSDESLEVNKAWRTSLSSLLDVRVPVMELEADRLHSAMSGPERR